MASAAAGGSGQASSSGGNTITAQQQQQALITALQNQNVSPVRLQTSGGSLVAVAVQQSPTLVQSQGQGGLEIVSQAAGVQGSGGAGGSSAGQQQNQSQQSQVRRTGRADVCPNRRLHSP